MSSLTKRPNPLAGTYTMVAVIAALILLGVLTVQAMVWGQHLQPTLTTPVNGLTSLTAALNRGETLWSPAATWVLAGELTVLSAVIVAVVWVVLRLRRGRVTIDKAARHMATPRELEGIREKEARHKAHRLGVQDGFYGLPVGETVLGRKGLFCGVEDLMVAIWGPRAGKTTSLAIPWILSAPGPVLATSNKPDIADDTRDPRARLGTIWLFDTQGVAGERATFWYNLLSYVTDITTAANLAEHFAAGSRGTDRDPDPYFDPAAQDLLASFFLAAALGQLSIMVVLSWLANVQKADQAVQLLLSHGYGVLADTLGGVLVLTDKQRDGIFGTASQMVACLKNEQVTPWISRMGAFDNRPQFSPAQFVRSRDTLYLLSKEGKGTAAPIVAALTAATVDAAEKYAITQPGRRLSVPLVGVLDEAANVCRWKELPNLYSHYGSRGILLLTILQSWPQGVEVWGETGMRKLWSSANVASVGRNVKDPDFLQMVSDLIGTYEHTGISTTAADGSRSVQLSGHTEPILDKSDLGAIPLGRAILLSSGARPTLIRTIPWQDTAWADQVRASHANHAKPAIPDTGADAGNPWILNGDAA